AGHWAAPSCSCSASSAASWSWRSSWALDCHLANPARGTACLLDSYPLAPMIFKTFPRRFFPFERHAHFFTSSHSRYPASAVRLLLQLRNRNDVPDPFPPPTSDQARAPGGSPRQPTTTAHRSAAWRHFARQQLRQHPCVRDRHPAGRAVVG